MIALVRLLSLAAAALGLIGCATTAELTCSLHGGQWTCSGDGSGPIQTG